MSDHTARHFVRMTLPLAAFLILCAVVPAEAGFKFTPAGNSADSSLPPQAPTVPVQAPLEPAYLQAPNAPASLLPVATTASARSGTVEGFANNVPLTVALRQVLPRGVMYSIADSVDTNTQVSWMGGRPWQSVLDDMLAGAGLRPIYSQNTVLVERATMAATPAPITLREPVIVDSPLPAPMMMEPEPMMMAPEKNYVVQPREVTSADPEFSNSSSSGTLSAPLMAPINQPLLPAEQPVIMAPESPPQIYDSTQPLAQPYNETLPGVDPVVMSGNAAMNMPAESMQGPWQATAGQSLHEILSAWAQRANIELNWLSEYDYPIQASMTFNGTFEEAVRTLLAGFMNAAPAPVGRLHRNDQLGQLALIIEARGNLYNE